MSLFNERSYQLHKKHYEEDIEKNNLDNWSSKDSVDYWRHKCMYDNLLPLIKSYPEATWLTVGDGRYGTDANYLISVGVKNVLASDISGTLLAIAKEDKFISDYRVENAEKMTFEDNSFDFVFCKESYHHFPRPSIALYEMLRVAKKGVILIEPLDKNINFNNDNFLVKIIRGFTNAILLMLGGINKYEKFETVGNYIFTISERELNKIALALNLKYTFYKKQNDFYIPGAENEKLTTKGPIYSKISKKIRLHNFLCKIGLLQYGLLTAVIMKEKPLDECSKKLELNKYEPYILPDNPYL